MNTTNSESDNNLKSAQNYYKAMLAKDFDKMASYLHNNVHFIGPLAEMHGKEAVVSAAKNFGGILQDSQIRSQFSSGNHNYVCLRYDCSRAHWYIQGSSSHGIYKSAYL